MFNNIYQQCPYLLPENYMFSFLSNLTIKGRGLFFKSENFEKHDFKIAVDPKVQYPLAQAWRPGLFYRKI